MRGAERDLPFLVGYGLTDGERIVSTAPASTVCPDPPQAPRPGSSTASAAKPGPSGAFFTASAQSWPACANRQYTVTVAGKPDEVWTVGPVSNTNGNPERHQNPSARQWLDLSAGADRGQGRRHRAPG
jgi:hypothetical protein